MHPAPLVDDAFLLMSCYSKDKCLVFGILLRSFNRALE